MQAWAQLPTPLRTLRVQLPGSSCAIQMENFLSLLESVDPSWLTPSSTTWAMDMIFAFVCGLGLFRLLLPLLPLDSPSPAPAENTTTKRVVKRESSKVRKKIRTVKAYRGSRKKPKEDKVLGSLLHSRQERLVNSMTICQDLGQDASGEAFKPVAAKAHLPPRQPTEESVANNSSLETCSAHSEHLLIKDSQPLSPVLLNSSPTESQSSVSASWAPGTLTAGRRHSPPQWAPSYPSSPLDPVACSPPMPHPSMAAPDFEWEILETSQSRPLHSLSSPMLTNPELDPSRSHTSTTPGSNYSSRSTSTSIDLDYLSRPMSTIPGLGLLNRPTSTTQGLDHLSRPASTTVGFDDLNRPTSTTLGLDHLSRPASTTLSLDDLNRPTTTTLGLDHLSSPTSTTLGLDDLNRPASTTLVLDGLNRPASTTPGLDDLSRPSSDPFRYQVAAKTSYHSNLTRDESLQVDHPLTIHEATFRTDPTYWQIEAGEPSFTIADMQELLEIQTSKGLKLKVWKEKEKERSGLCLVHSWSSKQAPISSCCFWNKNYKPEQFWGHQEVLGNALKETYKQLYWGHPVLHSESLVATVRMAGAPLLGPSILFNGICTCSRIQVQTNDPRQLCSPQPLLHHSVKSQPLISKFSWSRSPPETRMQTQAHDPSPLSKLPCHLAPIREDGANCHTPSGTPVIVPPAGGDLEHHLLKKHQESRSNLQVMVKESQEAFNKRSNSCVSQGQGSAVHLQGEFIRPKLQKLMEEQLKKRFMQHQGQCPHKAQLSLNLGQAQVNYRTSCPSALANESSQHPQSVSSNGPEISQPWRNPHQDLTKCLGRALRKHLSRSPDFETISETEEETCHIRHPRSHVPSVSPVGPGKNQLEGTPRNHSNSKWIQTNDSEVPKGTCPVIFLDPVLVASKSSKPNMETWQKPSFNDSTSKKTTNGPSILDLGAQKVLEAHITRRLVRHRWSLALRGLKTIRVLNIKAAPQSSNASLSWESRDSSIIQMASALGEPFQKDPEKEGRKKASTVESQSPQNCPSSLPVESLREAPPSNNSGPFEAPTLAQRDNVTSVWEFSVPSQSSNSRDIRELVETEEESCDWINSVQAGELGNIETNEFLETSGSLSSPSETVFQDAEHSGLCTPHCPTAGIGLQDCALGKFCQDWASEVVLAADVLVSRASQYRIKAVPATTRSHSKPQEQQHCHIFAINNQQETNRNPRQDIQVKGTKPVQGHRLNNEKFGDRIKSFILSILTPKYKGKESSKQKCKGLPTMTRSQQSVTEKPFMPVTEQVAEGQNLTTCVGHILKNQLGVHYSCVRPNPVNRPGSHHRIATTQSKKNQGNSTVHQATLEVHSRPAQYKGMPCGHNEAQLSCTYQHRAQLLHVPGIPGHCPRHCVFRNILPRM